MFRPYDKELLGRNILRPYLKKCEIANWAKYFTPIPIFS